ncbi:hypothetical protein Lal_00018696 [Lupinus albus]|nr:hypothetical protein Lal_00018696 [Lupinus albus]
MNVNGLSVTGPTYFDWNEMCGELLGKVSKNEEDMRGCELKLAWLVDNFSELPPNPTQIQLQQYCRARILYIIGGELLPDKSNKFTYIAEVQLVWQTCIGKCLGQQNQMQKPWVVFDASTILGIVSTTFSCTQIRWPTNPFFKCLPYMTYNNNLPREVQQYKKVWSTCTTLICFSIVEWHQTDRVRLQFGLVQDLLQSPKNLDALHRVDKRGNQDANWATKHAQ